MELEPQKRKKQSIFRHIAVPFAAVVIFDCLLLAGLLWLSGSFDSMRRGGLQILCESTQLRRSQVEKEMKAWGKLDNLGRDLGTILDREMLARQASLDDVKENPALNKELVAATRDRLLDEVHSNDCNGAFLVLRGPGSLDTKDSRAGVFFYDSQPDEHYPNNSDVTLVRGSVTLTRGTGVTLNENWHSCFSFLGGNGNADNDFYFQPYRSYTNRRDSSLPAENYTYWSESLSVAGDSYLFCSRPLVGGDGTVYGVFGVAFSRQYVEEVLLSGGTSDGRISYFLGTGRGRGAYYRQVACSGKELGALLQARGGWLSPEDIRTEDNNRLVRVNGREVGDYFQGVVYPLQLYGADSVFGDAQWVIVGLEEEGELFQISDRFFRMLILTVLCGVAAGLMIAFVSAGKISRPITRLLAELRNPERELLAPLEVTGIREVDELSKTISRLNQETVEEASRVSKIISLAGLPIGTFEKRNDLKVVFCSDGFFRLMNCDMDPLRPNCLETSEFDRVVKLRLHLDEPEGENRDIYLIQGSEPPRYVRLRLLTERYGTIGTMMDVTADLEKRRQIERERDYDSLTGLNNRRAFESRAEALFEEKKLLGRVSAMMMMDMDNLKTVNDTFGHEEGDRYIRAFADILAGQQSDRCIVGRRSGDEFYALYYGFSSREEIRQEIARHWENLHNAEMRFADGTVTRIRASGGVAWYPEDAEKFGPLLRNADFAMYRAKNGLKGGVVEFSKEDYEEKGFLVNGIQALNRMLEQTLVRYAFQPVVSARDGATLGYELLMRPLVPELENPTVVLALAREQGMLQQVEALTWRAAFAAAEQMRREGKLEDEAALFINTISNQELTEEEQKLLDRDYSHLIPRVVLEMTENESPSDAALEAKHNVARRYNARIAIDDFGTGYNGDVSLLEVEADYVKLDKSLVHDVQMDENRQSLVKNVVRYAHKRGIQVIAEGVEQVGELQALAALDVDYYQGFYLAYPEFEPPRVPAEKIEEIRRFYEQSHRA